LKGSNDKSSWFQKFKEVISSMDNTRRIFPIKSTHLITLLIVCAFAFFVVLNGPVEALSFPEGKLLAYQSESDHPRSREIRAGAISYAQEIVTYGIDQVVELTSPVTTDSKTVADKESDKCAHEIIEDGFYLDGEHDGYLLSFLISLGIFMIFVILIEYLSRRSWL
jgi:hypothetical protein